MEHHKMTVRGVLARYLHRHWKGPFRIIGALLVFAIVVLLAPTPWARMERVTQAGELIGADMPGVDLGHLETQRGLGRTAYPPHIGDVVVPPRYVTTRVGVRVEREGQWVLPPQS